MDIELIKSAIDELESGDTTYQTCQNLASLYIVLDHFKPAIISKISKVEDELSDILPSYKKYCDIKRDYQLGKLPKEYVLNALDDLCKEISQFISILKSSTDMYEERELINTLIRRLKE